MNERSVNFLHRTPPSFVPRSACSLLQGCSACRSMKNASCACVQNEPTTFKAASASWISRRILSASASLARSAEQDDCDSPSPAPTELIPEGGILLLLVLPLLPGCLRLPLVPRPSSSCKKRKYVSLYSEYRRLC